MSEQAQSITTAQRISAERGAWLTLFTFFALFCGLITAGVITGWRYYTTAMRPLDDALLRVHAEAGVSYFRRGSTSAVVPDDNDRCLDGNDACVRLTHEGDRVVAKRQAGYGPVASLLLPDQTHMQLWAHPTGADLTLEQYRVSRWTNRAQVLVIRQAGGYARYDIPAQSSYQQASYTVAISGDMRIALTPGGSYSINVPDVLRDVTQPVSVNEHDADRPLLAEVAVRSGSANLSRGDQQFMLRPGEKMHVRADGTFSPPTPAAWNVVKAGHFVDGDGERAPAWVVTQGSLDPQRKAEDGVFRTVETCPPTRVDFCDSADQIYVGQFRREVGASSPPSFTNVVQELDADVSEYTKSLKLISWVRVISQTVENTGERGSECPIMFTLTYKETSPTDSEGEKRVCAYTPSGKKSPVQEGYIEYRPLPPYQWTRLEIELRDIKDLERVRYLQKLSIEARGHDYISEITDVSIIGQQ